MPTEIDRLSRPLAYSICTLVTDHDKYTLMVESFISKGFGTTDCEYLFVDNSKSNKLDGYSGYNAFLSSANGSRIVICHQDILLIDSDRNDLDSALSDLDRIDSNWAACGNAGVTRDGVSALRISDPHGENVSRGPFPTQVVSLDENFVVVRRSANLGVSPLLSGFHMYATELCLVASYLGLKCYVIDFHLQHNSAGQLDPNFFAARQALSDRHSSIGRARAIATPSTTFFIARAPLNILRRLVDGRFRLLFLRLFRGD